MHRGPAGRTVPTKFEDPITIWTDGSIMINMTKLGSPENVYDADFSWISLRHDSVSLWFGKESVDAEGTLRSRLELRYPQEAFVRHFWKNSREFHQKLNEHVQQFESTDAAPVDPTKLKAERDASMWVNFDYISRTGTQASLDFFHLPPAGLAKFAGGHGSSGLVLNNKVRVLTTIHDLHRLFEAAVPVATEVTKRLPKVFLDDIGGGKDK